MSSPPPVTIKPLSRQDAQAVLDTACKGSWRQYPAYSQIAAERIGAREQYILFETSEEAIGIANVRVKQLPLVKAGIALISHGPVLLRDRQHWARDLADVLLAARTEFVEKQGLCLRIEPDVSWHPADLEFSDIARSAGFLPMDNAGYQTFLIDLEPELETLRKQLAGKWRTDLNRGQREDLQVTRSEKPEDIIRLSGLLNALADEKGFAIPQGPDFFASVAERAAGGERMVIHLVSQGDELLSGHIGSYSGNMATYLLGATSAKGRDLRASYVAQWAVIEYARELGLGHYDLGGVDKYENPSVYRFKERMGGMQYDGPAPVQCYPGALGGLLLRGAEAAYRLVKGRAR